TAALIAMASMAVLVRGQGWSLAIITHCGVPRSQTKSSQERRSTCILFWVSVPVLSEQMTVAEPIVSQATSWRTSELARVIFCMASASETVTLIGSPSGTATTMMMTIVTK